MLVVYSSLPRHISTHVENQNNNNNASKPNFYFTKFSNSDDPKRNVRHVDPQ